MVLKILSKMKPRFWGDLYMPVKPHTNSRAQGAQPGTSDASELTRHNSDESMFANPRRAARQTYPNLVLPCHL